MHHSKTISLSRSLLLWAIAAAFTASCADPIVLASREPPKTSGIASPRVPAAVDSHQRESPEALEPFRGQTPELRVTVPADEPSSPGLPELEPLSSGPANMYTLHVAGAEMFALSLFGDEVHVSTDRGQTWTDRSPPSESRITLGFLASALSQSELLLATNTQKLLRSDDAGQTWQTLAQLTPRLDGREPSLRSILKTSSGTLLAGFSILYRFNRPVEGGGLFMSQDAGATWTDMSAALPGTMDEEGRVIGPNVIDLLELGAGRVLAAIRADVDALAISEDGGQTWQRGAVLGTLRDNKAFTQLAGSNSRIYAATEAGLFVSEDQGRTLRPVAQNLPNGAVSAVSTQGSNVAVVAGSARNSSAWLSRDDGRTFSRLSLPDEEAVTAVTIQGGELFVASSAGIARARL